MEWNGMEWMDLSGMDRPGRAGRRHDQANVAVSSATHWSWGRDLPATTGARLKPDQHDQFAPVTAEHLWIILPAAKLIC